MIKRVFDDPTVIVSCCDDNYAPILCVMLTSIVKNSKDDKFYDIIIFCFELSEYSRTIICSQNNGRKNISIRIVNIKDELEIDVTKLIVRSLTKEIWLKSLCCYAMPEYEKAVVLDCDVICLHDIAELYETDIGKNLIGAVKFLNMYIYKDGTMLNYTQQVFENAGFDISKDYFNYGVVLQNLKTFRDEIPLQKFLELINKQNYPIQDQDLLNVLCRNRIHWIDARWNTYPFLKDEFDQIISLVKPEVRDYWIKAYETPYCIHYTTPIKPWLKYDGVYGYAALYFWNYAMQTKKMDVGLLLKKSEAFKKETEGIERVVTISNKDYLANASNYFVYGYGARGREIENEYKDNIVGFIDENKRGVSDSGKRIYSLDEQDISTDTEILISNDGWEPIAKELIKRGFKKLYSYYCIHGFINKVERGDYVEIFECMSTLYDSKSRFVFSSILYKRQNILRDPNIKYLDIQENDRYFRNDVYSIDKGERLLIAVDSVQDFERIGKRFRTLTGNQANWMKDVDKDAVATTSFFIIDTLNPIDILKDNLEMIQENTPKLAIDLSMGRTDLWKVPIFVKSINPNYKIYIRHHASGYHDTTMYASV